MSESGRYFVTDHKSGRKFCVETIGVSHPEWGDLDPVTKKMTGSYGEKYKGCVDESESIIKPENGFKNIVTLQMGESPNSYIEKLLKQES
jgi:hypothetical protein